MYKRQDLIWWNAPAGSITLGVPGLHNVRNALAALAVASWCGIPFPIAIPSLEGFTGTARRFELKGEVAGVTIYDDYAHHPTEIEATLLAARRRFPDAPEPWIDLSTGINRVAYPLPPIPAPAWTMLPTRADSVAKMQRDFAGSSGTKCFSSSAGPMATSR